MYRCACRGNLPPLKRLRHTHLQADASGTDSDPESPTPCQTAKRTHFSQSQHDSQGTKAKISTLSLSPPRSPPGSKGLQDPLAAPPLRSSPRTRQNLKFLPVRHRHPGLYPDEEAHHVAVSVILGYEEKAKTISNSSINVSGLPPRRSPRKSDRPLQGLL